MKKFYLFMITLFVALAANAETLSCSVYKWDYNMRAAVVADEPISVEAQIDGAVVTLPNFLGSDVTFNVTVNKTGIATHDQAAGYLAGPFSLGSFGSVDGFYLYAGDYGYDDFDYYLDGDVKTLHLGVYEYTNWDWFNLDIALPDDFVPANPYEGYDVVSIPITFDGTNVYNGEGYVDGNQVVLTDVFGAAGVTYSVDHLGNVTGENGWKPCNFDYAGETNTYAYFYGGDNVTYDKETFTVTDWVYFDESGAEFQISFQVPGKSHEVVDDSEVVDESTLNTTLYKWDYSTKSAIEADSKIATEVEIDGSNVILKNFLGSGIDFTVTCQTTGEATHDQPAGNLEGSFTFGSFGEYPSVYLYAGQYGYDDFDYYVEDGVKTLHAGIYVGEDYDWFDLYVELPDEYEPVNPFADKDIVTIPVTLYNGDNGAAGTVEEVEGYVEDGAVTLIGLFGISKAVYTIGEDGSISSNLNDWISSDYTYNGVDNTYVYSYGKKYLSYNAETGYITDYIWLYESNVGFYFTFKVPAEEKATVGNTLVYKWDYSNGGATLADEPIQVDYTIDGSVITLTNFLGSDLTINVTAYSTGKTTHDQEYGDYEGTFNLGSFGSYSSITLYAGYWNCDDFEYYEENGAKILHCGIYVGYDWDWFDLYISLPDSYEPIDPFAGKEILDVPVTIIGGDTYTFHAVVDDNTLTFTDLFGASGVSYTIDSAEGEVTSTAGWFNISFEYGGETNTYGYFYGDDYLVYNVEEGTIIDGLYLEEYDDEIYFKIQLPESLLSTTGVSNVIINNAPVEYYNLQGVRVNNPSNGIYIQRQGNKAQKVVIR